MVNFCPAKKLDQSHARSCSPPAYTTLPSHAPPQNLLLLLQPPSVIMDHMWATFPHYIRKVYGNCYWWIFVPFSQKRTMCTTLMTDWVMYLFSHAILLSAVTGLMYLVSNIYDLVGSISVTMPWMTSGSLHLDTFYIPLMILIGGSSDQQFQYCKNVTYLLNAFFISHIFICILLLSQWRGPQAACWSLV